MKKAIGIAIIAGLAGCSQADERDNNAEAGICLTLNEQIAGVQKEASYQMDSLMQRVRARVDSLPDPDDRSIYLERLSMETHQMGQRNAVLTLMSGHGCDLPAEPPELYEYIEAASACRAAEDAESDNMQRLCDRDGWATNSWDRENASREPPRGVDPEAVLGPQGVDPDRVLSGPVGSRKGE